MLRQIHRCVSHQPYCVFDIPSQSDAKLTYEVYSVMPDDPPEEYICGCRGFWYRGRCVHQDLAHEDRCMWSEPQGPEQQTPDQDRDYVCPRCGGETYHVVELIDE